MALRMLSKFAPNFAAPKLEISVYNGLQKQP
jgi:hypothetical protein